MWSTRRPRGRVLVGHPDPQPPTLNCRSSYDVHSAFVAAEARGAVPSRLPDPTSGRRCRAVSVLLYICPGCSTCATNFAASRRSRRREADAKTPEDASNRRRYVHQASRIVFASKSVRGSASIARELAERGRDEVGGPSVLGSPPSPRPGAPAMSSLNTFWSNRSGSWRARGHLVVVDASASGTRLGRPP